MEEQLALITILKLSGLRGADIENLLNDSDLEDSSPSDEDTGDPPFVINPEYRSSSSSDTDTYNDVQISIRSTDRGRRGSRGGSRGRARGFRNARVRGRITQEGGTDSPPDGPSTNGWTSSSFTPKEPPRNPSYLLFNFE